MCGWLKDRYGLSWQVVPADWVDMLNDADPARAQRMMQAMFGMKKLDVGRPTRGRRRRVATGQPRVRCVASNR